MSFWKTELFRLLMAQLTTVPPPEQTFFDLFILGEI